MKKIVFAAMAMLSMGSAFASENVNPVDAHKYVMDVNTVKMTSALKLNANQYEDVLNGEEAFADETRAASHKKTDEDRKEAFKKALMRNVKYMSQVLDKDQYRTYLMLLNTTLANRGINL